MKNNVITAAEKNVLEVHLIQQPFFLLKHIQKSNLFHLKGFVV